MVETTQTQDISGSDSFNGLDVTLGATLPTFATESFQVDIDLTQSGVAPQINVAVVVDTSGSTGGNSGSDVDGNAANGNETFLEAEVFAAKALFQSLVDAGYDPASVNITLVEYNSGASSLGTFNLDDQAAYEAALNGLSSGGTTNFDAALNEVLVDWTATTTDADPDNDVEITDTNSIVFLSDGTPFPSNQVFTDEVAELEAAFDPAITAIGVGAGSSLTALNLVDNTGGAQKVTDASQLAGIVSAPPPLPELQEIQIIVDGVVLETLQPGDPRLIETPLGYRVDCIEIDGYDYVIGEDIDVQIVGIFDSGDEVLTLGTVTIPTTVCFASGTMIMTPSGEVAIEMLAAGDKVITRDNGAAKVRWLGLSPVSVSMQTYTPALAPVRISAGALGNNVPNRDLWVSQQHRILISGWQAELHFGSSDGVLVPAVSLVNDDTIRVVPSQDCVTYVHLAFDAHEIVYAEGAEAESFHPNARTIAAMTPAQRDELFALFPELEVSKGFAYEAARLEVRKKDGEVLTQY